MGLLLIFIFILSFSLSAEAAVVVIDPGHGGDDQGAIGYLRSKKKRSKIYEKDIALKIAYKLKVKLKKKRPDLRVVLTRNNDYFVSLEDRGKIARNVKADLFVSIHCNSHKNKKHSGFETYILNNATDKASRELQKVENSIGGNLSSLDWILADLAISANVQESAQFAKSLQDSVLRKLHSKGINLKNRGIKQALFAVLLHSKTPGVLVETGFLSHPTERNLLSNNRYQNLVAHSMSDAISKKLK